MKKLFLVLLPITLFTSACSITGPAEDQWDFERNTEERLDIKGFLGIPSSEEAKRRAEAKKSGQAGRVYYSSGAYSTENLALDEESFRDFEEFKAWRRAQEQGTIDAQEYREWQEYQQYRAYKSRTEQTPPSK